MVVASNSSTKVPPVERQVKQPEDEYSPRVIEFVHRLLRDPDPKYGNAEAWLLKQKDIPQPDMDQMWEVLSGMVFNDKNDRVRARQLALKIENPEKRKSILQHYKLLEEVNEKAKK